MRTQSVECSKLGKTRIITDTSCGMVRNTGFCGQTLPPHVYLELLASISRNITYHFKEIFAYCDNSLYFAHRCVKRCTKILKLSFAVRTLPIACSKLGKTRTIADVRTAWLETAGFAIESRLPATGRIRRISPAAVIIYQSALVSAASRGLEDYRHLRARALLAGEFDLGFVLHDDVLYDRKPESCASRGLERLLSTR